MPAPQLSPRPRVMEQAIAWQLARVPMPRAAFDALEEEARQLAFTIAGFVRQAVLEEAYGWFSKGLAEGKTREELLEKIGELADQEGVLLSPARLNLIHQNHLANVQANGRWQQMNDPDLLATRPYRQYPLGPNDQSTSDFCRRMQGVVWRAGDPIEQHVWPPNHHGERHLKVLSLTPEQAQASGKLYEGPDGAQYPMIEGQTMLPDPGFDAPPRLLAADSADLSARVAAAGAPVPAKTAASYGLDPLAGRAPSLAFDEPDEIAADWKRFRKLAKFPGRDETVIVDQHGDGVLVNEASFDALGGRLAGVLQRLISDPVEIWFVPRENGFSRRYLALVDTDDEISGIWAEASREGWLHAGGTLSIDELEELRGGLLLASKLRKVN